MACGEATAACCTYVCWGVVEIGKVGLADATSGVVGATVSGVSGVSGVL